MSCRVHRFCYGNRAECDGGVGFGYDDEGARERLEYLRGEIRAERISYGEIAELQDLAPWIDPSDVELLEWAGVPEFNEEDA